MADEIVVTPKKVRVPFDKETMGYGVHKYEHIDPATAATDFFPEEGRSRRDYNTAFNYPNKENTCTLDVMSRVGAIFETSAEGFAGQWEVRRLPVLREGVAHAVVTKPGEDEVVFISCYVLGLVAHRTENRFLDQVRTVLVSGGKAGRSARIALTKQTDGSYKAK